MSAPALICVLIVAIALIVVLIVKVKLHPALALTLAAFGVGIVTGTPLDALGDTIEAGVGGTLGFLALIIGFGSILGKMLEVSGGAERIADSLLHWLGRDRAAWVMMLIGFIAGIPVFVEVGFVLLVPLVFVIARQAKISTIKIAIPLVTSLMVVHCIVPPHPAATAIAGTLGADIGKVIVLGLLVGLPCAAVGGPVFSYFGIRGAVATPVRAARRETRRPRRRLRGGAPSRLLSRRGACPASESLSSRSCCPFSSWSGALSWCRRSPRAAEPCPSSTSSATRSPRCSSRSSSPTGRSVSGGVRE